MAKLADLAQTFATQERPAGNLLDEETVLAQAVAATRFYAGFAALRAHEGVTPVPDIDGDTAITTSEWALIRPLFLLYAERETALQLEASRGMGIDPFGRSASEIAAEITQAEADMPHRAFFQPIITV
ncbi:hypothetical protein OE519_00505 [Pseudomonas aeruginosa]|jgi:hypothetical protein|uniref:hypothetical protein n=1 Tax=Pseudomonadota TaxID=1224 RepID=UPI000B407A6E|nr:MULTISPECIES: hypothetical protein [Pseudomonadota]MBH4492663.1 hypothetical protein [Pseudomonas aeruginosa]MCU8942249.1 hypothetical protein [Pseudomonas aeruginosa]MDH1072056.1 hypothetical protein [Pseudomonas nitroreducens]MDN8030286.1 hypothetical protein [Burkholderia multivorans]OVZ64164.1 hypothetical protein CDO44_01955 [Pigmentiphaga sp. NML080357]